MTFDKKKLSLKGFVLKHVKRFRTMNKRIIFNYALYLLLFMANKSHTVFEQINHNSCISSIIDKNSRVFRKINDIFSIVERSYNSMFAVVAGGGSLFFALQMYNKVMAEMQDNKRKVKNI